MAGRTIPFFAALLIGTFAASYAIAAGDACLPINRIVSTEVIDNNTVVVTTLDRKLYTVHMRGVCIGLDKTARMLSFRTKTELGCLSRGDSISYNRPAENTRVSVRGSLQTPCYVDGVEAGARVQGP